jgi:sulfur carrier protein ThiS
MRLHLGGHLNWYDPEKRSWLTIQLVEPVALVELLDRLQVPPGEVALAVVNGRLAELEDVRVFDGDRVELYPPIGGGSLRSFIAARS